MHISLALEYTPNVAAVLGSSGPAFDQIQVNDETVLFRMKST